MGLKWQKSWAAIFGFVAPLIVGVLLYEIVQVWPLVTDTGTPATATTPAVPPPARTVDLGLWFDWTLTQEQGLIVLTLLSGLLGGLMYTMAIYARRRSRGQFRPQDANWYWVRCVIAAGLALTVYALIRGGLFALGGADADDRPTAFAVLGIGVIAGLFTDKVLQRLRDIAGNFFASPAEEAAEGAAEERREDD